MKIALYQAETEKTCRLHASILEDARQRLLRNSPFSLLEQQGLLHSLQVLIENSIGKAKHVLKFLGISVPISAYDAFDVLHINGKISIETLNQWNRIIGLRNNIVHEYMTIDIQVIFAVIKNRDYEFIIDFLKTPFDSFKADDKI